MSARAEELSGPGAVAALEVFSQRGIEHGDGAFGPEEVQPPARLRFYHALAEEQFVLDEHDERVPVSLG
jgi:hypothetical protein